MNLTEALKELYGGKKIRRKAWFKSMSYQLKNEAFITLSTRDILADDWEVVKEDILTKDEKEYLENILLPYTDNYVFTFRKTKFNEHYYLRMTLIPYDEEADEIEYINLPLYRLNKPVFANLEEDYLYNLNDLKLFKD